jgi:hypothetical protein
MILRSTLNIATIVVLGGIFIGAGENRVGNSVAMGLSYLTSQQDVDGSFESPDQKFATTAWSLRAFLASGNTSDGGRYSINVRRATEFLIHQGPSDHNFGRADGSGTEGQAIVTLALCEEYGVEPDETTRARVFVIARDSARVIMSNNDGGQWRALAIDAARRIGAAPSTQPTTAPAATTQLSDDAIIKAQLSDGSWPSSDAASSRVRETSRAIIDLSSKWNLIPMK